MGFFNSFKGQIGRDTGKVISNFLWGDKHASVYRRAQSRNSARIQEDKHAEEFERLIENQKIEKVQRFVDKGVTKVISMKIPQKKELIIEMLQELTVMLIANTWGPVYKDEFKITNKYSDAILAKFEQALFALKVKYPNEFENIYYEKQFDDFYKIRRKKKYTEIVLIAIVGVLFFCFLGLMSYNENAEKKGKPSLFEKLNQ